MEPPPDSDGPKLKLATLLDISRLETGKMITVEMTKPRFDTVRTIITHDQKDAPSGSGGKERKYQEDGAKKAFLMYIQSRLQRAVNLNELKIEPEEDEYTQDRKKYIVQIASRLQGIGKSEMLPLLIGYAELKRGRPGCVLYSAR